MVLLWELCIEHFLKQHKYILDGSEKAIHTIKNFSILDGHKCYRDNEGKCVMDCVCEREKERWGEGTVH